MPGVNYRYNRKVAIRGFCNTTHFGSFSTSGGYTNASVIIRARDSFQPGHIPDNRIDAAGSFLAGLCVVAPVASTDAPERATSRRRRTRLPAPRWGALFRSVPSMERVYAGGSSARGVCDVR